MVQYIIGFSFMAFVPTILAYLVLSLLSLGLCISLRKKSDQDIKKLEERELPKNKIKNFVQCAIKKESPVSEGKGKNYEKNNFDNFSNAHCNGFGVVDA
ncbi:hypothetical protein V7087_21050 [Neobacillus niacini]|uniref:hypothetical protein n=1 Tax=Neobacillus niacini TaxID=86668 RepID=UPI002FFF9B6A